MKDYFPDINRAAVIVKLKKPFIDWLVYTSKEHDGPGHELKPEDVQTEGFDSKHVYLILEYDETEKYEKFVKKHCSEIFEHELRRDRNGLNIPLIRRQFCLQRTITLDVRFIKLERRIGSL